MEKLFIITFMPRFEELPPFSERSETKNFSEAANDDKVYDSSRGSRNSEFFRRGEYVRSDYLKIIGIFTALKKLAGDRVFTGKEQALPEEWNGELSRLNRAFRALTLNEGLSESSVEEQFRKMLCRRNFDDEIAKYEEWVGELDEEVAREKVRLNVEDIRLEEIRVTPEQFHGPEDGPETKAVV